MGQTADPNRISAQIVSGIGFLGAGAIMQSKKGVFGLTTAATIWVVAAVGVAIGSGYPLSATIFTFTVLVVLKLFDPVYSWLSGRNQYHIEVVGKGDSHPNIQQYLGHGKFEIHHIDEFIDKERAKFVVDYYLKINVKDLHILQYKLNELDYIKKVTIAEVSEFPSFEEEDED